MGRAALGCGFFGFCFWVSQIPIANYFVFFGNFAFSDAQPNTNSQVPRAALFCQQAIAKAKRAVAIYNFQDSYGATGYVAIPATFGRLGTSNRWERS
jgi:hypothetical protein